MKKALKIFAILIGVLLIYSFGFTALVYLSRYSKPLAGFLITTHLKYSCSSWKSGCDELRPLPKVLQNKKIIFGQNTNIEFDPYQGVRETSELDTEGFLGVSVNKLPWKDVVDPKLKKTGYLAEREYKIIRAVYHYNCSYCIDSSDYAYIVLEDSKGNRFISFLDEYDSSVSPAKDIPWDDQLPYALGKDKEWKLKDSD